MSSYALFPWKAPSTFFVSQQRFEVPKILFTSFPDSYWRNKTDWRTDERSEIALPEFCVAAEGLW
jgi:hypothetical protein